MLMRPVAATAQRERPPGRRGNGHRVAGAAKRFTASGMALSVNARAPQASAHSTGLNGRQVRTLESFLGRVRVVCGDGTTRGIGGRCANAQCGAPAGRQPTPAIPWPRGTEG
eukprot:1983700-Prymnesium_polylepis.1